MISLIKYGRHRLRYSLYSLCLFVFLLSWGAKLALYETPHASAANPVSATKLWVSKTTAELDKASPAVLPERADAALLTYSSYLSLRCDERMAVNFEAPASAQDSRAALHRCLRPPPAL